jgi:predicted translin family RNA/ssDNA-binding protein
LLTFKSTRAPRLDSISSKIEDFAKYKSLRHYLKHACLISPTMFVVKDGDIEISIVTDEEYLAGACIGLCHELVHYSISRASSAGIDPTVVTDIQKARDIVAKIFEELLQFDFRNSPLRRKYDSTKYALKSLETILYELSVAKVLGGSEVKKVKLDEREGDAEMATKEDDAIPKDEFAAIRARMEHRDQLRERLIKTCRDGQKAAKQSIFALHRGDTQKALKLLRDCEQCVTNDLMPILYEEPDLRGGSFSGVLEEYVEAYLFYSWLQNEEEGKQKEPSGKVLGFASLPLLVSPEEYLGGLCDLSGEIGRYAVAKGTHRDKKSVQLCLDTNKGIYNSLRLIGRLPSFIFKKKSALKMSVEKLERMMYELSLMEMTGREYTSNLESNAQADDE